MQSLNSVKRLELIIGTLTSFGHITDKQRDQGYKMFENEVNVINSLKALSVNSIISRIDTQNANISGIPGTQQQAISDFSASLINLFLQMSEILDQEKQRIDARLPTLINDSKEISSKIEDTEPQLTQINIIKESVIEKRELLTKKNQKYLKVIDTTLAAQKVKKVPQLTKAMSKIEQARNEDESLKREVFVTSVNACMPLINRQISEIITLFKKRNQSVLGFFKLIKESNQHIIDFLQNYLTQYTNCVRKIDFQKDFTDFVKKKKIIRYDITTPEFVPIKFDHPCFANIKTITRIQSPPLYPIAMATPLSNFIAAEENQFSLQLGKCVLLMEPLDLPWCLVQNPFTKVMGYAPSNFLRIIGHGVGVLLKDYTTRNDDLLNTGDYVALERKEGNNVYAIVTALGQNDTINSSLIGIISEF